MSLHVNVYLFNQNLMQMNQQEHQNFELLHGTLTKINQQTPSQPSVDLNIKLKIAKSTIE